MAHASRMSQEEKRDANKSDRIDLTIYMATTPKENLPRGVANRWSADLMPPGSKEEADLRKFMEDPAKNKFVLFFETKKEAMDYARAMDLLLGRSGVLSNVVVNVSEKSARDEEEYTLAPGQNYKISLSADNRGRVAPLKGREDAILGKFRAPKEGIGAVVPAKKPARDDDLDALDLGNPEYNVPAGKDDMAIVPQKKVKEEKGVARIVENPLRGSYVATDGDTVKIFKTADARNEAWNELLRNGECTFTVAKRPGRKLEGNPEFLLESMPSNVDKISIRIEKEENGEYTVKIRGKVKITQEDVSDRMWGSRG